MESALSRTNSASRRRGFCDESRRLLGSMSRNSGRRLLLWRYVDDMTKSLIMCFTSQLLSRNSAAIQSSNSGWLGGSPWAPRSSTIMEIPFPKNCFQSRFISARGVSGFSFEHNHLARSRRVRRLPSCGLNAVGRNSGEAGDTTVPVSSIQLPRGNTRTVSGCGFASVTSV